MFLRFNRVQLLIMKFYKKPSEHFIEVSLRYKNLKQGEKTLILPVWTPGYYKILDNPAHIIRF